VIKEKTFLRFPGALNPVAIQAVIRKALNEDMPYSMGAPAHADPRRFDSRILFIPIKAQVDGIGSWSDYREINRSSAALRRS
jgi:hypothetical protein